MTHQSAESDSQADSLPGDVRGAQRKCMNRSRENLQIKSVRAETRHSESPAQHKSKTRHPSAAKCTCDFSIDFGFTAMTQGFGSNLCQSSQRKREAQLQAKKKLSRDRRRQFHHSRRSAPRTSSPDRPIWRRRAARSDARTWTRTPGEKHPAARAISPNPSS